ncbi:MAG TPA: winged helix-turn-helix transcriptional regulator [Candidatus Copromonas faecavium]|uniref:Winged helix-turn-helix transcriptional regulator n=1 Tax=Candidatus Copromonas faecavium (nom. illeg.) TaxID=2840740 RepID=A0A9D1A364_9FIRM|nr:winged helix-turn-helix transcriptional regulator [Candidatus Copromonas faecavium]
MSYEHLPHNHGQAMEQQGCLMPETADFQIVSDIFKQLGDSSRVRIFWILCHCEECVINLSAMMEMSSPAVSHHLKLLKGSGLIISRREGKEVYYRAADTEAARLLHHMIEKLIKISCPSGSFL